MKVIKYSVIGIVAVSFSLFLIGCGDLGFYNYEYKMVEPAVSDNLSYSDENIDIYFAISLDEVSYLMHNELNKPVTLLYDRAVYVDHMNFAHDTIHSTLSLLSFDRCSSPKVIPPKTKLYNYFAPVEKIDAIHKLKKSVLVEPFDRGTVVGKGKKEADVSLSQLDELARSNIGKRIGVFLPVEIDNEVKNYFFKFEITSVSIYQSGSESSLSLKIIPFVVGVLVMLIVILKSSS